VSSRLGITYLETWTAYTEGKLLAESGAADAADLLAEVHVRATGSPRIASGALLYGALVALRTGKAEHACHLAEKARSITPGPSIVIPAVALLILAHLAMGDEAGAAALAPALAAEDLRLVEHDELVELARSELALARGPVDAARAVLQGALSRIDRRAASLDSLVRRNEYLARPPTVVRTRALGRVWLSS
jgi:ATP/maltotriose-dependent transcriptional regulator MalT